MEIDLTEDMEEKFDEILEKIAMIEDEIQELESYVRILRHYMNSLKYPSLSRQDWSVEAENILKRKN